MWTQVPPDTPTSGLAGLRWQPQSGTPDTSSPTYRSLKHPHGSVAQTNGWGPLPANAPLPHKPAGRSERPAFLLSIFSPAPCGPWPRPPTSPCSGRGTPRPPCFLPPGHPPRKTEPWHCVHARPLTAQKLMTTRGPESKSEARVGRCQPPAPLLSLLPQDRSPRQLQQITTGSRLKTTHLITLPSRGQV